MVMTKASDPDSPPSATDSSSLAESVVSWSKSRYWDSLREVKHGVHSHFFFLFWEMKSRHMESLRSDTSKSTYWQKLCYTSSTCTRKVWGRVSLRPGSQRPDSQYQECRDSPVQGGRETGGKVKRLHHCFTSLSLLAPSLTCWQVNIYSFTNSLCSWSCRWSPGRTCRPSYTRFPPTRWRSLSPDRGWSCAAREHDPAGVKGNVHIITGLSVYSKHTATLGKERNPINNQMSLWFASQKTSRFKKKAKFGSSF